MINRKLTEEQVLELIDGQDLKMGGGSRDRDRDKDRERERDRERDSENSLNIGGDYFDIIDDHDIYGSNILFDIVVY